jgi:hypothetical protein
LHDWTEREKQKRQPKLSLYSYLQKSNFDKNSLF